MSVGPAGSRLSEEVQILQTWVRLSNALGKGDADGLATILDPECDHRTLAASGHLRSGRDALARALADASVGRATTSSRRLSCSLASVRFMKSDVAIVDGTLHFSAGIDREGHRLPAGIEPFTAVMRKGDDHCWLIAACRVGALAPVVQ